ncbi:phospholipid-transporting ATPase ABCA3-like [Physella acuta]|uniref:phospholipid-transporting ATPase ABCA3-like n=1 Tax=Physella acuta TaxID=109671 RepID=UPI0027DC6F10|nr:phospholipid-transporting ATPase ABCA3-like [Physella acuta]
MPEWVEMGCQFSALTYKNICLYKSSLWITILELTLTILVAVFFIKFGHDTTTVKHFPQTNINLEIKPHFTYMPDTATLTKMVNVRWKNPTHFKAVSSLAEKPLVVFRDMIDKEGLPHDLKFRVVLYEKVPTQKVIGTSYNYANKGLISAQLVVSELYLNHWKKERANLTYNPILLLKTQMMPQIQVERDVNIQRLTLLCPYLPAILLFFCVFTTALIVEEKVSNIKKTLKMLGLRQPVYWGSWFVARLCFGLIVALIVAVSWSAKTANGPLFQMYFISLYGLMLLMVINSLTFSLTLSSFLNDGSLAGLYALIAFTGANAISKMIESRAGIWTNHFVGTLLFSHGIRKCFDSMCASEMQCEEDQDSLLQEFCEGLVYMLLNTVVNVLLLCVVERTGCGEGRSLFHRCWNKKRLEEDKASIPTITQKKDEYFEPFQENAAAGIVIRDLVKMYGQTMVVAGVSLDIYTNQITTLLGHDGAGKTTLISMILGLTPITRGQVMIDGMDVTRNLTAIRKTLGFCPQHDLFFPRLTVYEHMVFYTKMRHDSITKKEAYQLLTELNLEKKMSTNPLLLTDGQKRKVSIACAFAGNTKTIFLDEPSTGLDPSSRRRLWRCLMTWRSGRTILMTTHSMDEADYLSDRVAIMANGVVECCGTPMFLKKTYGVGYKLTLVKAAKCKVKKVVQYILNAEEAAIFKSSTNTELVFLLPEFCVSAFPKFLQDLEEDLHLLRIQSYGLSTTSIEDVFLKIWELDQSKIDSEDVDPDETDLNDAELSLSRANLVSRGGVGEGGRLDTDMDRGEGGK